MFGLLKLLAYGLFGYAAYEFFRGLTQVPSGGGSGSRQLGTGGGGQRSQGQRQGQESRGTPASLTASEGGTNVSAQSADGGSMQHRVGRGVVSR